jgi:hypothetical protein
MCAFRWRSAQSFLMAITDPTAILSALRTRGKLQVATAAEPPMFCALLEAIGQELGIDPKPLDQLRCAAGLISYGFLFGWSSACFGWSGVCFELFSPRTIFPSQEIYAVVISSRSFFRLNSISAILCSSVLCSSGICSFLSGWDSIGKLIRYCELSATVSIVTPCRKPCLFPTHRLCADVELLGARRVSADLAVQATIFPHANGWPSRSLA